MNNRRKQLMLASAKEYCKCVVEGKTLKYNNQCNVIQSNTTGSGTTTSVVDGVFLIQCTSGNRGAIRNINIVSGHKYFATFRAKPNYNGNVRAILFNSAYATNFEATFNLTKDTYNSCSFVGNASYSDNNSNISFYIDFGEPFDSSKNIAIISLMIIDLTALGLGNITNASDFFATDLGKYIAKGNDLPYEPNGKFIQAQSPINFEGVNIWNEQWKNGIWYNGVKYTEGYNAYICTKDKIKVKQNTYYYYYNGSTNYDVYIIVNYFDKNGNFIRQESWDNNTAFLTPNNCKYIAFYINDTYGGTYHNDICINEWNADYNGKYQPYCGGEVLDKGFALQKGDKYKTYTVEEISYNNLISNIYQDYVNSDADTRDSIILSVYDYTNNISVFAEGISSVGFYEYTFTSNTTTYFGAKIYNSGVSINQNFAENISLTNGHKYYLSLKVSSCDASFVGGLRIANLRLIDLTQLGLDDIPQKLGLFLKQNYRLPVSSSNRTIKVQIVRTFKEIDLSSFTWENAAGVYYVALPKDIKLNGQAIAEKYANDDIWIAEYPYDDMNLIVRASETPNGKALLELATPEIITDYPMDFVLSNDNLSYDDTFFGLDGTIFALPNGLIPVLENGIPKLEIIGDELGFVGIEYGNTPYPSQADVYYANGFRMSSNQIAFNVTNASGNLGNFDEREFLVGKTLRIWVTTPRDIPDIMVSRRTINVESQNEIDMDFTKE